MDLYIGGSEHATGHLLYSRFWQKFMFDKGLVPKDEFAKKLINQGMITGTSAFVNVWIPSVMARNSICEFLKEYIENWCLLIDEKGFINDYSVTKT